MPFVGNKVLHLSVIVRENRAGPKDRGRPFTFIFAQYKSYPKRSPSMIFAEVRVRFSSRYHHIMILVSQVVQNGLKFQATLGEPKRYFIQIPETLIFVRQYLAPY